MSTFLTQTFSFIPKRLAPSRNDIVAAGMWGGTAVVGALWLVQPFDFLKTVIVGGVEEAPEKEEIPKPPSTDSGENLKHDEGTKGGAGGDKGEAEGKEDSEDKEE